MKNKKIDQQLERIHEIVTVWPGFLEERNLMYDTQNLYTTLQKREEIQLLPDKAKLVLVEELLENYGETTHKINNSLSTLEDILEELDNLDDRVEQTLSGDYRAYVEQAGLSVRALYHYKNNELVKAQQLSEDCIDIVDELIEKGLQSFVFRAIEMNKNLSTVFYKMGRINESDAIKSSILSYHLKSHGRGHLYGVNFDNIELWNEMPYLRECFGYYFFVNYSTLLSDITSIENKRRFNALYKESSGIEVENIDQYRISKWIEMELATMMNSTKLFWKF